VLINSQLVTGLTFQDWLAAYDAANRRAFPQCVVLENRAENVVVDGTTALLRPNACNNWRGVEVVFFHGDRAYSIRVFPRDGSPTFDPRPVLDEWLTRFRLTRT
jgi:hypothetical protein